jgi:hypothetical protein
MSSLYCSLWSKHILQEPIVTIKGVQIQPYLLEHATYLIRSYLLKGYKPQNNDLVHQIWFDQFMNKGRVLIENAFGTLRNWWRILKKFNARVDQTFMITLACCTLHDFCQLQGMLKLVVHDGWTQGNPFVGFISMCWFHKKLKKLKLLVKRCEMQYLNLGYNAILEIRFTFCCFM